MTFLKKTIKSNQSIELYKFNGENFITLPQNFHDENTIKEGVNKLAKICQREFGVPMRISNEKVR